MLKPLVRNTLFTGVAHLAVGLIGFVIVPFLVRAYDLAGFGLIVLARVVLPTGPLSILDFGVSETTTQAVARARTDGSWARASGQSTLLLWTALGVGGLIGAVLVIGGPWAHRVVDIDPAQRACFSRVIQATGWASPLLFAGLVVEGMTKGFERYDLLRFLEVLSALAFAVAAWVLIRDHRAWDTVALAFLFSQVGRGLVLLFSMVPLLRSTPLRLARWDRTMFDEVRHRSVLMFQSRVLGVIQFQSPPLLIGALVGPAGVGVYDILVRLPRFAKSVLSLLISALLPVSARLEAGKDHDKLKELGRAGFWLMPALAFPPLLTGVVFAPEFLREWVGPKMVPLWPWFALMFLVPLLNILLSYGQTLMQVRLPFLRANNRLLVAQVILQLVLSLGLVPLLKERSFILGQVVAMVAVFPLVFRLLIREQGLPGRSVSIRIARLLLIAAPLAGLVAATRWAGWVRGPLELIIAFAFWNCAYWALIHRWGLGPVERGVVRRIVNSVARLEPRAVSEAR